MQEPMKERRRQSERAEDAPVPERTRENSPTSGGKKSVLARFRPRAPWRPSAERRTQKAKACQEKQKRMEAAIAMMAAGASTEDVDEMAAARAAMEAEFASDG